jgi:pimeloyl-ACP methyl ester carboxylesterase
MRRWLVVAGTLIGSGMAWIGLRSWPLASSEAFYVLLPPLYLALYLEFAPSGWIGLKAQLPLALGYVACLAIFFLAYSYFMARTILPANPGAAFSLKWFNFWEVAVGTYFLVAISLIMLTALAFLRWLVRKVDLWLFLDDPSKSSKVSVRNFLLAVLPSLLLLLLVLPYVQAALFIYRFKVPNPYSPQELIQRESEDVAFRTEDGLTIRGWFLPAKSGRESRTLIICHGLGANRSNFLPHVQVGDALEANVLMFDFRGHGDSDGHTVSVGYWEKFDVLAAVKYLREARPASARQVFALGISMGSAALIRAAAEVDPPLDGIIVDSSFPSAQELTNQVLGQYPSAVRPFIAGPGVPLACLHAGCWLPDVRPIDDIARVRAPVLMIHDQGDNLMILENAQRLFNQALEPKKLWVTRTGGHGGSFIGARKEYLQTVREFFDCQISRTKSLHN